MAPCQGGPGHIQGRGIGSRCMNRCASNLGAMEILHYTAFSADPAGGNPAGVVLDATGADEATMQRVAAELGYSETAFLTPRDRDGQFDVRYFSQRAEVPFCGHATVATAVAYAERYGPGRLTFHAQV